MTQHDYAIADQTFPATRSDLNNVLNAIKTLNSGTSAPSTTAGGLIYFNTTDGWVYQRNAADSAWLKKWRVAANGLISQSGVEIYGASASGNDTYAVTLNPAPTAYAAGMMFNIKPDTANTGACTLNVNSLGAKALKKNQATDPATGDILANQIVTVVYDGTNFQIVSKTADNLGSLITEATAETSADDADLIAIYDNSASAVRKMTRANFLSGVGGGAMTLIQSQSASSDTSIDFTTGITSTYDAFKLVISGLVPATNDTGMMVRVSEDAGSTWKTGGSDYSYSVMADTVNTAAASATEIRTYNPTSTTMIQNASGKNASFEMSIHNLASSSLQPIFFGKGTWEDSNTGYTRNWGFSGRYKGSTNAINGIRLIMTSGNITSGTFSLYGVNKT